jgi:hypothetical protein
MSSTYDHTHRRIRDPVRSPIVKPVRGGLVVGSVTTSESPLLYVTFAPTAKEYDFFFFFFDLFLLRWVFQGWLVPRHKKRCLIYVGEILAPME